MEAIVEGLPDRPITRAEFEELRAHDRVVDVECVMGVVVTDQADRYDIDAYLDPIGQTAYDYYMDLIIETESSVGIAAYPKVDFPPPDETDDMSPVEIISAPAGEWTWISKGQKPDYDIKAGLWQLEEYRDFGPDGQDVFETMIETPTLRVLIRNQRGVIRPFINLFLLWLRNKVRR